MLSPQLIINDLEPRDYCSYALKSVNLTVPEDALDILDDMVSWLIWGGYTEGGCLEMFKEFIEDQLGDGT